MFKVYIDGVETTAIGESVSFNKIGDAFDTATFTILNPHDDTNNGVLDTWNAYKAAVEVTIKEGTEVVFRGIIYDVVGDRVLSISCKSKDSKLEWYTINKGNTTFNLLEAKVKQVLYGTSIYLKDDDGNDIAMTADAYNGKYVIVSDSTLGESSDSLVNGENSYLGTDSYTNGAETNDYTDVENSATGTGDNWEVYWAGGLDAQLKQFLKIDISYLAIPITATLTKMDIKVNAIQSITSTMAAEVKSYNTYFCLATDPTSNSFTRLRAIPFNITKGIIHKEEVIYFEDTIPNYVLNNVNRFEDNGTIYTYVYVGFLAPNNYEMEYTYDIEWKGFTAKLYYDTGTFDVINAEIDDTYTDFIYILGQDLSNVSPNDKVIITETMDHAYDVLNTANTELPNIPNIEVNNGTAIEKGVGGDYNAISAYDLFRQLNELNNFSFFYDHEADALRAFDEADNVLDGGELTSFTKDYKIEQEDNRAGKIEVWYKTVVEENPIIVETGNGDLRSLKFVRNDILTRASAIEFAEKKAVYYADYHWNITLKWDSYVSITPGYMYSFSISGVDYEDLICRRVNMSYAGGKYSITGYFGGGHTPTDEKLYAKLRDMNDRIILNDAVKNVSSSLLVNWTGIYNKPLTFTPTNHATSHGAGEDDEITIAESQISDLDHWDATDTEGVITAELVDGQSIDLAIDALISTHTEDADAHHAVFENLVEDTTPELGGNLDTKGNTITDSTQAYVETDKLLKCKDNTTGETDYAITEDQKGEILGVCPLDAFGQVDTQFIKAFKWGVYLDTWDASGGTYPDNADNVGEYYICIKDGTVNGIAYTVADIIIWDGAEWDKITAYEASVMVYEANITYLKNYKSVIQNLEVRGKHWWEIQGITQWGTDDDWVANGAPDTMVIESIYGDTEIGIYGSAVDGIDRCLRIYMTTNATDAIIVGKYYTAATSAVHTDIYVKPHTNATVAIYSVKTGYGSAGFILKPSGDNTIAFNDTGAEWSDTIAWVDWSTIIKLSMKLVDGDMYYYVNDELQATHVTLVTSTNNFKIEAYPLTAAPCTLYFYGMGTTADNNGYLPFSSGDESGLGTVTFPDASTFTSTGLLMASGKTITTNDDGASLVLKSLTTGNSMNQYIDYQDSNGVERAYFGFGSPSTPVFYIVNTLGNLSLYASNVNVANISSTSLTMAAGKHLLLPTTSELRINTDDLVLTGDGTSGYVKSAGSLYLYGGNTLIAALSSTDMNLSSNLTMGTGKFIYVNMAASGNIQYAGSVATLQIIQPTANYDSFMTFHVAGDFACHFGIDGGTNDLHIGGWSLGTAKYKLYHQNNSCNQYMSGGDQFLLPWSNGSGYVGTTTTTWYQICAYNFYDRTPFHDLETAKAIVKSFKGIDGEIDHDNLHPSIRKIEEIDEEIAEEIEKVVPEIIMEDGIPIQTGKMIHTGELIRTGKMIKTGKKITGKARDIGASVSANMVVLQDVLNRLDVLEEENIQLKKRLEAIEKVLGL